MIAAVAGLSAGGAALWSYNRGNFLFDRKLRQEQEFTIFEWRKVAAELWRDDIRDLIELTEKKMDSYLVIATLQMGMCAQLFACGRLQPGTPPWLLTFYMLTLSSAFMYLMMSVWFAMHASVSAQCVSVRMLTQFVRLPVPDWQQMEGCRTYASSYENVQAQDMFRVPCTSTMAAGTNPAHDKMPPVSQGPGYQEGLESLEEDKPLGGLSMKSARELVMDGDWHADPWRLELHGDARGLYELQRIDADLRRHILLAKRASVQFQTFDAFARLSMAFGTHQFLYALSNYSLGYVSVMDGAAWPGWCVACIMMGMSVMMFLVDFSMPTRAQFTISLMAVLSLVGSCASTSVEMFLPGCKVSILQFLLPATCLCYGCWLYCAFRASSVEVQPESGAELPMKLKAVFYLDVFGWLSRSPAMGGAAATPSERGRSLRYSRSGETELCGEPNSQGEFDPWFKPNPMFANAMKHSPSEFSRRGSVRSDAFTTSHKKQERGWWFRRFFNRNAYSPVDEEGFDEDLSRYGPAGEIKEAPPGNFGPRSYVPPDLAMREEADAAHDPRRGPARIFRGSTYLVIFLWFLAMMPTQFLNQYTASPMEVVFRELDSVTGVLREKRVHAAVGSDVYGLPELIQLHGSTPDKPSLGKGESVNVGWPGDSPFIPKSLSCDPEGNHIIIGDDFGIYVGKLEKPGWQNGDWTVDLMDGPACIAMEGKSILDVTTFCNIEGRECSLFALHRSGMAVTWCPLKSDKTSLDHVSREVLAQRYESKTWRITEEWLSDANDEKVKSIAIESGCRHPEKMEPNPRYNLPDNCMIVGTTKGRVITLQGSADDRDTLVPSHVLFQRAEPSSSGSLSDLPGGVTLALWYENGLISAVDENGNQIGEWTLPEGVIWLMICSNVDHIYALGVRGKLEEDPHEEEREAEGGVGAEHGKEQHHESSDETREEAGSAASERRLKENSELVVLHRFQLPPLLRQRIDGAAAEADLEGRA